MMNPLEIKKLREAAPLPIILGTIMMVAPWLILDPQLENVAAAEMALDQAIKNARTSLTQRAEIDLMNARKHEMERQLARIENWLVPEEFLPNIIDWFHELAGIFSVRLNAINYGFPKTARENNPPRVFITFEINGDYSGMRAFLQALECFPLPLVPMEISANSDKSYSVQIMHLVKP